ncbi:MAG TPA: hypothetical protein VGM45_08565, partial [Gaiellaceae bacterium]
SLTAAHHLLPPMVDAVGGSPVRMGTIIGLAGVQPTAAHVAAARSYAPWIGAATLGVLLALSAGAFTFRRRRRTAAAETSG